MAKKAARKGATKSTGAKKTARAATRKTGKRATGAKKAAGTRKTASGAKKRGGKRTAAKRETIDTGRDKRYVRRGGAGRFKESDDVSKSLRADARKKAKTKVKKGQGDRGDR